MLGFLQISVESATGRPLAQTLPAPAVARADQARRQGGHVPQSGQLGQGHQARARARIR